MNKLKILAIGDFHGKIPLFLPRVIKKERPDLIISIGDFCDFSARKIFFKYVYKTDRFMEEVIGKRKTEKYYKKDNESGKKIIGFLKELKIPIIAIMGNTDPSKYNDISTNGKIADLYKKYYLTPMFKRYEDKNFKIIDMNSAKFQDFVFIGTHKSSYQGYIPGKKWPEHKKQYLNYKQKLEKIFKKYKKEKIILLSHNVPFKILDKIKTKNAEAKKDIHKGSFLTRTLIKKFQPLICISGHMHENQGTAKLGKTLVVNTGSAMEKKLAIISIYEKNKIKVRLLR
jgi:Icc-related predicted phosphoesterase